MNTGGGAAVNHQADVTPLIDEGYDVCVDGICRDERRSIVGSVCSKLIVRYIILLRGKGRGNAAVSPTVRRMERGGGDLPLAV